MKNFAFLLAALLALSCGSRQAHLKVADAIANGVNSAAPAIVEQYKVELRTCRVEAQDLHGYTVCAAKVEERWGPLKDAWRRSRRMHDAYATMIEKGEPVLEDYVATMRKAWCELADAAKGVVKMPDVPGLRCGGE